ncbi:hypothetical protein ASZ90_014507 [hydrocarbon metagenome]|uniref:Uncharacterized protein n=1 Tax=hydrocarbon metagenome TaxID=938273 RepID=A0A0W8F4T3_9ZZZZ
MRPGVRHSAEVLGVRGTGIAILFIHPVLTSMDPGSGEFHHRSRMTIV